LAAKPAVAGIASLVRVTAMPFDDDVRRDKYTEDFLRLISQHDRALYAYILALVPSWADADDLAQEVRIRLWQQFPKYEPGTNFEAWARSVAYYLVLAYREKASRDRLHFGLPFLDAVSAEFAAEPDLLYLRQEALSRCMEKLDAARRSLIEQHYAGEHSLHQIAERTGRSYEATRKTVYRTQLALADCIQTELHGREADE
jgi:RNA polymerase sigma-70 factor (ECF subfamily)